MNMIRRAIIICCLVFPSMSLAAELYLEVVPTTPKVGGEFTVKLFLDPQGEMVNAIEGSLSYSQNLSVSRIYHGDSFIPLWMQAPVLKGDSIYFAGIVPGGYEGEVSSKWQGYRPGKVLAVVFQVEEKGRTWVQINRDSTVLLHDGKGTEAPLYLKDISFSATGDAPASDRQKVESPAIEWEDAVPPEHFTPVIIRNPDTKFGGKYYLIFEAVDKKAGIDRYEVKEGDGAFVPAESPYLLKDQRPDKPITVRAIDKAENVRVEIVEPVFHRAWYDGAVVRGMLIGMVVLGIGALAFAVRRIKRHQHHRRSKHGTRHKHGHTK